MECLVGGDEDGSLARLDDDARLFSLLARLYMLELGLFMGWGCDLLDVEVTGGL